MNADRVTFTTDTAQPLFSVRDLTPVRLGEGLSGRVVRPYPGEALGIG